MSGQIRTFNITIGKVYNNGVECKNPKVELEKRKDIAVNCIDPSCGLYQIQISPKDLEPCLTFLVTCDDCDICGTKVIEKCLCDTIDDCEKCEICNTEGFCESTCTDICEDDGTCVECNAENPCPCNQDCQNGKCTCPAGSTLNANGCCDECQNDGDCDTCSVCILVNGGKTCQAKDCNCDLNGKCGTAGECVECTQSGHCPENERCNSHCECECAPGYTRINGICTPTECPNGDEDCPPCFICSGLNCVPNQCPSGKVPVVIDGECACVQECNCEQPNCSSEFNFCGESAIEGKCGCIPCKGNCTDGCEDPCICDEDLDKCKFNPCFGSCENGSDCGPTCGCLNGECVPCEILDCATQECGTALGCACSNTNNCEKDDHCNDAPCSVASDCADGCTCDQGTCKSCANYACPNDCSQHDGCACNDSNKCDGDDTPCGDTLTIEKDEANCDIIGTLTKDNCCQCSPLTLDIIPPISITTSGSDKKVTFKAELRKGTFDGISVYSNPRLDNTTHSSIAENEEPLPGAAVTISYTITSKIYNNVTGTFIQESTTPPTTSTSSFLGNAEATFNLITLPSIGKVTILGNQKSVVYSIKITFTQYNVYTFPNDCAYREGKVIGIYNINKNEDFSSLLPIGTTITSSDCRKPLFKWTKSSDSTFDETPFRKIYVDPKTVGVYEDIIDAEEGAESCFHYNLEPDCTCDDPASKYVVFCNPSNFNAEFKKCGRRVDIQIEPTCDTNIPKKYQILINGDIYKTIYLDKEYNESIEKSFIISTVSLKLECDLTNECLIEKHYTAANLNITPTQTCVGNGKIDVKFESSIVPESFRPIIRVEYGLTESLGTSKQSVAGVVTINNLLQDTTYYYKVFFTGGCQSDILSFNKECCEDKKPTIDYDCLTSKIIISNLKSDGLYYLNTSNNIVVPNTSGEYTLTDQQASSQNILYYTVGDCSESSISISQFSSSECCNILYNVNQNGLTISVTLNSGINPIPSPSNPLKVEVEGVSVQTITSIGGSVSITVPSVGSYTLNIYFQNNTKCKKTETITLSECDLDLELIKDDDNCKYIASTNSKNCTCDSAYLDVDVISVQNYDDHFSVSYNAIIEVPYFNDQKNSVESSTFGVSSNNTSQINQNVSAINVKSNLTPSNTLSGVVNINKNCQTQESSSYSGSIFFQIINETNGVFSVKTQYNLPSGFIVDSDYASSVYIQPYGYSFVSSTFNVGNNTFDFNTGNQITISNNIVSIKFPIRKDGNIVSNVQVDNINLNLDNGTQTVLFNFTIDELICSACEEVTFSLNNLLLEDGCNWSGDVKSVICQDGSFFLPEKKQLTSTTFRKIQFDWAVDSTHVLTEYGNNSNPSSELEAMEGIVPGAEHTVTSICSCEESQSISDCFETEIIPSDNFSTNCNKTFKFKVKSCYIGYSGTASISNVPRQFTIGNNGESIELTITVPNAIQGNVDIHTMFGSNKCQQVTTIENDGIIIDKDYSTCVADEYTITFSSPNGACTIISQSSTGTISGSQITDVPTSAMDAHYAIVSVNGCEITVPFGKNCTCDIEATLSGLNTSDLVIINSGICTMTPITYNVVSPSSYNVYLNNVAAGTNPKVANSQFILNSSTFPPSLISTITTGLHNIQFKNLANTLCDEKSVTLNVIRVNASISTSDCISGTWNINVSGLTSGATVTARNGVTVIGSRTTNGSISVTGYNSATITITYGSCTYNYNSGNPVSPTTSCVSCSHNLLGTSGINPIQVLQYPCTTTSTSGSINVSLKTKSGCSLTSASVPVGYSVTQPSGNTDIVTITTPSNHNGGFSLDITDDCGCEKSIGISVNNTCCDAYSDDLSVGGTAIFEGLCDGETKTISIGGVPPGHNTVITRDNSGGCYSGSTSLSLSQVNASTWNITITSWGSGATCQPFIISLLNAGNQTCNVGSGFGFVINKNCDTGDPCGTVPICQQCISGELVADASQNGDTCDVGKECCNGTCVLTSSFQTDEANCGECGTQCSGINDTCCSGGCVDLDSNVDHCGACGSPVDPGEVCCGGSSVPACTPPSPALSGSCNYVTYSCTPGGCGAPIASSPIPCYSITTITRSGACNGFSECDYCVTITAVRNSTVCEEFKSNSRIDFDVYDKNVTFHTNSPSSFTADTITWTKCESLVNPHTPIIGTACSWPEVTSVVTTITGSGFSNICSVDISDAVQTFTGETCSDNCDPCLT